MTPSSFSERVTALINAGHDMTPEERVSAVNDLIESYVQATGDVPPEREVARLTNFILEADLKVRNKRHVDRPVYTDDQLAKNARRAGITLRYEDCKHLTYADVMTMGEYAREIDEPNETERLVRRAIEDNPKASNREIARKLGISHTLVARYRKSTL